MGILEQVVKRIITPHIALLFRLQKYVFRLHTVVFRYGFTVGSHQFIGKRQHREQQQNGGAKRLCVS